MGSLCHYLHRYYSNMLSHCIDLMEDSWSIITHSKFVVISADMYSCDVIVAHDITTDA